MGAAGHRGTARRTDVLGRRLSEPTRAPSDGWPSYRPRCWPSGLLLCVIGIALLAGCTDGSTLEEPAAPPPVGQDDDPADTQTQGPIPGGTLRVGLLVDPVSIDPRFVVDDEGELLVDALFDPLVRVADGGEIVPAAARRWEVQEDGRRFTFHLRAATFHDGSPVTAEDFKRTFDHIADGTAQPPSFLAYLLEDVVGIEVAQSEGGGISGVEVVDERTLTIELREPQPGFLTTLADPSLVPLPPDAAVDHEGFGLRPIGNGPFAMAGPREPGAFLRLVRFQDHHRPPLLDEVLFTLYDATGNDDAQWTDLLDGQLHVTQVSPARRDEAEELFGRSADGYTGPGVLHGTRSPVYMYGFDTSRPPFDDPRLRRALSLSIDRDALAEEVAEGTRLPATAIIPPGIPGWQPGACADCRHDPAAARDLLEEVVADLAAALTEEPTREDADGEEADGGPASNGDAPAEGGSAADGEGPVEAPSAPEDGQDGEDAAEVGDDEQESEDTADVALPPASELLGVITLSHNRGRLHGAIAERFASDIEDALGLEVEFQGQELASFIRGVRSGDLPVFRHGWDVTTPAGAAYLYPLFHSSQVGRDNLTRFEDGEVDALLEAAREADDPVQRRRAVRDAERQVLAQLPVIPLLWYRHEAVIRPEVRDLRYDALGRLSLSEAWFDPDVDADRAAP